MTIIGFSVYLKTGTLKGNFSMYESMQYQNVNPEDNNIVLNEKLFHVCDAGRDCCFKDCI